MSGIIPDFVTGRRTYRPLGDRPMRLAPSAFISCCSLLLTLIVTSPASADSKKPAAPTSPASPTRRAPSDNPQVQRNNIDSTIAWTDAAKEYQDIVRKMLVKVLQATPKPSVPYALSDEEVRDEVGAKTGMVKGTQHWVPIEARGNREYMTGGNEENDNDNEIESEDGPAAKIFDIQVALNSTRGLTTGIATKSDKAHIKEIEGAVAVEQSAIPFVDSTQVDSGRAPEEPMTLLRIYVVDPDLETQVRKVQKETGGFPGFGPTQVLADHPDELRSIVISYYGPKKDVDAIARKIDMAALRRLLPG